MLHALRQLIVIHLCRAFANDENQIDMIDNPIGLPSHNLLNHSPHAVAHDRIADLLAGGDPYAEPLHLRTMENI